MRLESALRRHHESLGVPPIPLLRRTPPMEPTVAQIILSLPPTAGLLEIPPCESSPPPPAPVSGSFLYQADETHNHLPPARRCTPSGNSNPEWLVFGKGYRQRAFPGALTAFSEEVSPRHHRLASHRRLRRLRPAHRRTFWASTPHPVSSPLRTTPFALNVRTAPPRVRKRMIPRLANASNRGRDRRT